MTPGPGIEPGTHWWKASALTTTPTLLPLVNVRHLEIIKDNFIALKLCFQRNIDGFNDLYKFFKGNTSGEANFESKS